MERIARNGTFAQLTGPLATALTLGTGVALAQSAKAAPDPDPEVALVAQLDQATHEQLKALYVDCSNASERRLLGLGEATACSIVYETLKRRVFGGDFMALLAWSRAQRALPALSAKAPATATMPMK